MSLFGNFEHHRNKYLLEIISPMVGSYVKHWDIYQPLKSARHLPDGPRSRSLAFSAEATWDDRCGRPEMRRLRSQERMESDTDILEMLLFKSDIAIINAINDDDLYIYIHVYNVYTNIYIYICICSCIRI